MVAVMQGLKICLFKICLFKLISGLNNEISYRKSTLKAAKVKHGIESYMGFYKKVIHAIIKLI